MDALNVEESEAYWFTLCDAIDNVSKDFFQNETPEDTRDRKLISKDMHREGIFHNQQHFLNELLCRMAQKKEERYKIQREDAKMARGLVKTKLYRAMLKKQMDLLDMPSSPETLDQYEKIVDALGKLKAMHHDNWWIVNQAEILNNLIGPEPKMQCMCCPLSLDK